MATARTAKIVRSCLATGLAIVLAGATAGIASASTSHSRWSLHGNPGHPALAGTVATAPVDGSFTVTTHHGTTVTVDVATTTTFVEQGVSDPSLTNVTVGELIIVFGSTSASVVSATEVSISTPRDGVTGHPVAAGTVATAPVGDSFTITTRAGTTVTVDVTPTTTYMDHGVSSLTLVNVTVGELVAVFGTSSGSTITASDIAIRSGGPKHFATGGTVQTAPVGNTFTVMTWRGTVLTIEVSSTTTYMERDTTSPTLANVSVGEFVAAFGTTTGATVSASEIVIAQPQAWVGTSATGGTVTTAPTDGDFTITTWNNTTITIDTTSATTYAECAVSDPTLADVAVGDFVGVVGTTSGPTVTASEVLIAGSQRHGLFGYGHAFNYNHGRFGGFGGFGFGRGNSDSHTQDMIGNHGGVRHHRGH